MATNDDGYIHIQGHRVPVNRLRLSLSDLLAAMTSRPSAPPPQSTVEAAVSTSLAPTLEEASPLLDENNPRIRAAAQMRIESLKVRDRLTAKVLGQEQAVDQTCDALMREHLLGQHSHGPKAVLLFVGPAMSGKGLAATTLANAMDGYQLLELDLGQIADFNQTALIDGTEPSYKNAGPGRLTSFVKKHPKTVVLFRNIERCHPAVLSRLEPMLSSGQLRDQYGIDEKGNPLRHDDSAARTAEGASTSFDQAILVFSTKAGEDTYGTPAFQQLVRQQPTHAEAMLLDALARQAPSGGAKGISGAQFSTALLNHWRGGRTVLFRHLELHTLTRIAQAATHTFATQLTQKLGTAFSGHDNDALLQACLLALAPEVGAGEASTALPTNLFAPLLDQLLRHPLPPVSVQFLLSEPAMQQWIAVQQRLKPPPHLPDDVLEQCRRRNLKLELAWEASADGTCITLCSLELAQVKRGSDLSGPGALRIEVPSLGFDAIAGHQVIKRRLAEVIKLLNRSHEPGVRHLIPAGMLLYGPPGTGKTMLAKALAHEADLPFINTTGTELLDPALTRQLFARARRYAPSMVFIDEIDALGSREHRGHVAAINQLLAEMDGFDSAASGMVFVVAATNLAAQVDPALRRPGRLDLHLEVPPLDPPARTFFVERIFALPVAPEVQKDAVIRLTAGMTGAQLEQLKRELQLLLQRDGHPCITPALLLETVNALRYGQRTTSPLTENYLAHTAIHEAGHAVASRLLNPEQVISQISIVPRGSTAGFVAYDAEAFGSVRYTLDEVNDQLCVLLAGRTAQNLLQANSADHGAQSDLQRATALAVAAVTQWGLVAEAGLLALDNREPHPLHPHAATAQLVHVQNLLQQAERRCTSLLQQHWPAVLALQQRLLAEEYILDNNW